MFGLEASGGVVVGEDSPSEFDVLAEQREKTAPPSVIHVDDGPGQLTVVSLKPIRSHGGQVGYAMIKIDDTHQETFQRVSFIAGALDRVAEQNVVIVKGCHGSTMHRSVDDIAGAANSRHRMDRSLIGARADGDWARVRVRVGERS